MGTWGSGGEGAPELAELSHEVGCPAFERQRSAKRARPTGGRHKPTSGPRPPLPPGAPSLRGRWSACAGPAGSRSLSLSGGARVRRLGLAVHHSLPARPPVDIMFGRGPHLRGASLHPPGGDFWSVLPSLARLRYSRSFDAFAPFLTSAMIESRSAALSTRRRGMSDRLIRALRVRTLVLDVCARRHATS